MTTFFNCVTFCAFPCLSPNFLIKIVFLELLDLKFYTTLIYFPWPFVWVFVAFNCLKLPIEPSKWGNVKLGANSDNSYNNFFIFFYIYILVVAQSLEKLITYSLTFMLLNYCPLLGNIICTIVSKLFSYYGHCNL